MSTFDELRRRTNAMASAIAEETGLKMAVVLNIIQYAKRLAKVPDMIEEAVFVAQLGLRFGITCKFYVQLIFEAVKIRNTKQCRLEDYVRMIAIFCSKNLDVKIDFVFNVYDFQKDGYIDLAEMYKLLESSVLVTTDDDPAVQVKELIDIVISLVDTNNDGRISLTEFRMYVYRDILCLELFGQVLPSRSEMERFTDLMEKKAPMAIKHYFTNERAACLSEPVIKRKESVLFRVSLDMP